MAEGTENVEDCISCDDSSYGECNLEVYDSGDGVNSGSDDEEYGGGDTDALGKEPYLFTYRNRSDDFATLHPAPTSAQDGLYPLQLALVLALVYAHIQMSMFCNLHTVVLVVCGGDCMYSVPCACACVRIHGVL